MNDRFAERAAEWNFNPRIIKMFRAFVDQFRKEIPLTTDMNLLDVGGGTGLIAFDLADSVKSITIVDSSPAMVKTAREHLVEENISNVTIIESDILHADLGDQKFDRIYGHMSFHHIENIDGAFDRFAKLLVPGGMLIIGDLMSEDGSFHGEETVPHNGFDPVKLSAKLMIRGFSKMQTLPLESMDRPETGSSFERFFLVAVK